MEYIISPLWVLIELFSVHLFAEALLQARFSNKKKLLVFAAVWIVNSLSAMFIYASPTRQLITISAVFAAVFACYRGSVIRHIICVLLGIVFIGVMDFSCAYLACAVMGISYEELIWKKLLYVVVSTVAKLIALFASYLFRRFRRNREIQRIHGRWLVLTLLFPALSFLLIIAFFAVFESSQDLPLGSFAYIIIIAVANLAVLYLIEIMEKRTKEEQELILLNQQMHIQTDSILALEKSYRTQRKASHEFMHHLQTISDLLASGAIADTQGYIREIQGLQTTRIFAVNSRHAILDAVFNQKYQAACEQNTEIVFQVNDLSLLNIKTNELVVIFSNLLDNALEACQQLTGSRQILCSAVLEEAFFISIRNTSPPVTVTDGTVATSKTQKNEHGYGLPNVCRILDSLHAEYTFQYRDGWFQFVAEIPVKHST